MILKVIKNAHLFIIITNISLELEEYDALKSLNDVIFKYEKDNLSLKEQVAEVNRLLQKEQNKNKVMLNK